MAPKIRNIIIFVIIGAVFVFIYIFYIKPKPEAANLVSKTSPVSTAATGVATPASELKTDDSVIAGEFLTLLSSVKNIKLNSSIFSNDAFKSLRDSSITLIPDGNEGRPNPFAPLGVDVTIAPTVAPTSTVGAGTGTPPTVNNPSSTTTPGGAISPTTCALPKVLDAVTKTCVTPKVTCTLPKVLNPITNVCVNLPAN